MLSSMPAWLTALGWALLNAYWQFALLCALYFLLCRLILLSPAARFRLAFSLVLSGTAWFFYYLFNHPPASLIDHNEIFAIHLSLPAAMNRFYSAVAMAYLLILSFISIRQLNGYHSLQRQSAADRQQLILLELFMKKIAGCWGLSPHIRIFSSAGIRVPQTMGFLKPVIFFPLALLTQLNTEQLEAILLHELAHIRRKDYLTNLVMITLRTLFFFNPFVGRLIRAMQEEREHACDEMVLAADYPANSYAAALLQLERSRQSYGSLSLAATGVSHPLLLTRIRKMHGLPVNIGTEKHYHSILPSLLLSLGAGFVLAFPVKQPLTARQPLVAFPSNELQAVNHHVPEPAAAVRHKKSLKVRKKTAVVPTEIDNPAPPVTLLRSADDGEVSVDWTDQREERDFSHEDAEKPIQPNAGVRSQMPYIPSASFMYQHAGDSIRVENHQPWIAEEKMENVASAVNAANLGRQAVQSFRQQLAGLQKLAAQKRADLGRSTDQQKRLLLESLKQIRTQQEILRRIILSVKKPAPDRLIYI